MYKIPDSEIIGTKINGWTVLDSPPIIKDYKRHFLVRCACGKEKYREYQVILNSDHCRTCENKSRKGPRFEKGQQYYGWEILRKTKRVSYFQCKCLGCGFEKPIWSTRLKHGTSGCKFCKEKKNPKYELAGKVFGNWQAEEIANTAISDNWKIYYWCKCIKCGYTRKITHDCLLSLNKNPRHNHIRCWGCHPKKSYSPLTEKQKKIVEDNKGLVYNMAIRLDNYNKFLSRDERVSAGYMGLIRAVQGGYRKNKSKFSTYASNCIKRAIQLDLKNSLRFSKIEKPDNFDLISSENTIDISKYRGEYSGK